ncbi:DNA polymerase-3 subunit epsilon [Streptomyces sp. WMMB 322]|nr:DNA polymerase-3 subunit epsilon [Streptomyces sp. WMMB 322]
MTSSAPDMSSYAFDWALVDVETSGLWPRHHRVLSVAVITVNRQGEQTGEFSTLVNPGCDPGPVHIHGLTPDRLRGAPRFEEVADHIGTLLKDRVMVAHNAQFDYDFLAHEFARARSWIPVSRRLCTLALNRQLGTSSVDLALGSLAGHYGIPQHKAHDALDDARVLSGVLRESLREAAHLDIPLPLLDCPPRQETQFTPQPPKTPCAYRNPGRLVSGGRLKQGMKVAITGETAVARAELVARAVAAGLNVMTSVSRHTSLLVTNDRTLGTAKAKRAAAEGVPVLDERSFLKLLGDVRPGVPHRAGGTPESTALARSTSSEQSIQTSSVATSSSEAIVRKDTGTNTDAEKNPKPLLGHRVLVLGGPHPQAAKARSRIVELGGAAAVNLSGNVTDLIVLQGGYIDPRRMRRIQSLDLPTHEAEILDSASPDFGNAVHGDRLGTLVLPRGGVIDLPSRSGYVSWTVAASWGQQTECEIDIVAFSVDEDEQVTCDADFVFYGAPEGPNSAVRLSTDAPTEQAITVDLASVTPATDKVVICAALDGDLTFGDVGAIEISTSPGPAARPVAQATLDAATTERTLLLAEIYRRGPTWRLRAVGQGYDYGLDALARGYGVDVAE